MGVLDWFFESNEPAYILPDPIKLDLSQKLKGFDQTAFVRQAVHRFLALHGALAEHKLGMIRPFVSDGLFRQFLRQQSISDSFGKRAQHSAFEVDEVRIVGFESDPYFDTIHVGYAASDDRNTACEVWSFLRKHGVEASIHDDGNCPSCGAKLDLSSDLIQCPFCKVLINSGHHSWVLAEMSDASVWKPSQKRLIPGLAEMQQKDPSFCIQIMEDRMKSYFWLVQHCMFTGHDQELRWITTDRFVDGYRHFTQLGVAYHKRNAYVDVQVNSVELSFITFEHGFVHLYFTIAWDGRRAVFNQKGRASVEGHRSSKRQSFTMVRDMLASEEADTGLSTLSCPNCGGPLSFSRQETCSYCQSRFIRRKEDWLLDEILNAYDVAHMVHQQRVSMSDGRTGELPESIISDSEALFAGVVGVLVADGVLSTDEMNVAEDLAKQLKLRREFFNGVIEDAVNHRLEMPMPRSHEEARVWLKYLVDACLADGKVAPGELDFLADFGKHFGFTKMDVEMMVNKEATQRHHDQLSDAYAKGNDQP